MSDRQIIVIGGGIIGVTTAYELARRGHATVLLEAREGVARETSHANGAILTPSMADPWNAPGVHRQLVASLFDPHSAMKLRLLALPSLANWGVRFLRHSTTLRHAAATRASFVLAKYSVDQMRVLRDRVGLRYDAAVRGTLKIFRDARSMSGPLALADMLSALGLRFEVLERESAVAIEPALDEIRAQIAGALHFPDDESGDAFEFCQALTDTFQHIGGTVKLATRVQAIALERGRVTGVESSDGPVRADAVVIAAGHGTGSLLRPVGITLPIKPVKGYSLTFDAPVLDPHPRVPVIDDARHVAIVPLGARLRLAGTAEFAGTDLRIRPERIENLRNVLGAVYPSAAAGLTGTVGRPWTGLRPVSADGLPFVGATSVKGLYVNVGHGHLGWTLAMGSAHLLADLFDHALPQIDPMPYRAVR